MAPTNIFVWIHVSKFLCKRKYGTTLIVKTEKSMCGTRKYLLQKADQVTRVTTE